MAFLLVGCNGVEDTALVCLLIYFHRMQRAIGLRCQRIGACAQLGVFGDVGANRLPSRTSVHLCVQKLQAQGTSCLRPRDISVEPLYLITLSSATDCLTGFADPGASALSCWLLPCGRGCDAHRLPYIFHFARKISVSETPLLDGRLPLTSSHLGLAPVRD